VTLSLALWLQWAAVVRVRGLVSVAGVLQRNIFNLLDMGGDVYALVLGRRLWNLTRKNDKTR
jgi:hypothetical protein